MQQAPDLGKSLEKLVVYLERRSNKMTRRYLLAFGVLVLGISMIGAPPTFAAQREFFAIATGGTGGTYYPLGGLLAQALSDQVAGVIVTAQAANASVQNCNLIAKHQVESAFVQNNVAYAAYKGEGAFKEKPVKNLRGIASLYPETIQIIALSESGIKTLKDIKGKRLIPGDRGSGTEVDCLNILKTIGLTYKDFSNVDWLSFSGASQRLKDKQADVTFNTAGWPTAAITELATTANIIIVPIDDRTIAKLVKDFPFYAKIVLPAGTYRGVDKDVPSITTMAQWVVDADVSAELVYKLTKALWEKGNFVLREDKPSGAPSGAEVMAVAHAQGKNVTPKTALSGMAIPLHPGAEKYYKEKGMVK